MVCLEYPEPHIRMLWGTQFVNPSFVQPTGRSLPSREDIRLGILPATVVVQPEWLSLEEVAVPRSTEMKALIARLALGHPWLPVDTPRPERVSVPRSSLAPLSLVHPLMVFPILEPATSLHMMHANSNVVGMKQGVAPLFDWMRATTVKQK